MTYEDDDKSFEPHQGAIAFCSRGQLGLITGKETVLVAYNGDDTQMPGSAMAWTGIHLSPEKFGQPWSSRAPRVVGRVRKLRLEIYGQEPHFVVDGRNYSVAFLNL